MRYELSDKEWSIIPAMLPTKPRGAPRVDDRRVLIAIGPSLARTFLTSMALAPRAIIASFAGGGTVSGTAFYRR
jgi:transposase